MVFFTQITMEAAEDPAFLDAMRRARIKGALVGVEAVTPEGLKDVYKGFNLAGEELVKRLREFRHHGVHILGSFIFGLPSDRAETFDTTLDLAKRADLTFAQFVLLTPFPGTLDFDKWAEKERRHRWPGVDGVPVTQALADPRGSPAEDLTSPHPTMTAKRFGSGRRASGIEFYSWGAVWARSRVVQLAADALAFMPSRSCTGRCTPTPASPPTARASIDRPSARAGSAAPCARLFVAQPMPDLAMPAELAKPAATSGRVIRLHQT